MTVKELIEKLTLLPQDMIVTAYDDEASDYIPITHIGISSNLCVYIETQQEDD